MHVASIVSTDSGAAVLLSPEPHLVDPVVLPIFIGGTEALSMDLRVKGDRYPRPLTHDLLDNALFALGSKVLQARVTKLAGTTFFGAVIVANGASTIELDARPSDAIALAVGNDAPIFVAPDVMARAAMSKRELLEGTKGRKAGDPTML